MKAEDYSGQSPKLDIQKYFSGKTTAWGMFQSRGGEVKRRFKVDLDGRMEGDELVLTEDFTYADGEKSQRIWRIRKTGNHQYIGRAGDVVGEAVGEEYGNALNWHYTLALEVDGKTWNVKFNDWMFLQDDQVLLNRAVMSKFGIRLGEITLAFVKPEQP